MTREPVPPLVEMRFASRDDAYAHAALHDGKVTHDREAGLWVVTWRLDF